MMTSLTLLNGGHPADSMMNATTCYIVSSSAASNYTDSLSSSTSPILTSTQHRIAPKMPHHHHSPQQQQDLLRCKRRIQLGQLPTSSKSAGAGAGTQPAAVARRNERERNRVRLVNMGFATLRQHVPNSSKNKKMSKVDTLRSAVDYIKRLQELLGDSSDENSFLGSGQCSTGSPTPSLCSESSSPYEVMAGDEDEELIDFASWF